MSWHRDSQRNGLAAGENGIFAIRGDLDGTKEAQDYSMVRQFIGLLVGDEEFLLPMEAMNEIIMLHQLTYVPGGPKHVEGVINLRGKIIPAINLRTMMGLHAAEPTGATRVIIAQYEDVQAGILVDGITYVVSLAPDQLENQTLASKSHGADLITGISKQREKVNGILDISKVILRVAGGRIDSDDEEAA